MSTNVLCIWQPRQELLDYLLKGLEGKDVKLVVPPDLEPEGLLRLAPDADIVLGWRPTPELLDAAARMKLFINPGAGVQHLVPMFRGLGRPVTLVNGHGNSYFTAQHTVALLLALMNKVIPHHNWMLEGRWRTGDDQAASVPLRDLTVGLLGYGHVNSKVHLFLVGYDVAFAVLHRQWPERAEPMPTPALRFSPDRLHDFLKVSDVVIASVPQTSESVGMLGRAELDLLGPNGFLVNVGRGAVVDEEALYEALRDRRIAGAAIDVWYDYRPEPDDEGRRRPHRCPFHELDNVVLSPHRAASPLNDLGRWDEVIDNITRFAAGRTDFLNIVDLAREY
jgi:phosphoglycerate dehydrogenase-like enzyme